MRSLSQRWRKGSRISIWRPSRDDVRVDSEKRLGVAPQVDVLREEVRFLLGVMPHLARVGLGLVIVEKNPAVEVVDLGEPPEAPVRAGVIVAHEQRGAGCDGVPEEDVLPLDPQERESLVLELELVLDVGLRSQPALADEPAVPNRVAVLRQAQPPAGLEKVPSHPGRPQPHQAVVLAELSVEDAPCGDRVHAGTDDQKDTATEAGEQRGSAAR
jgi:hypothetical protein